MQLSFIASVVWILALIFISAVAMCVVYERYGRWVASRVSTQLVVLLASASLAGFIAWVIERSL
jgi:hypothetical protein